MNSKIFDSIGLTNLDPAYIVIVMLVLVLLAVIFAFVSIVKVSKLKKRIDKFMKGSNASSLESDIAAIKEDNDFLKIAADQNKKDIRKIYRNLEVTYQKIGLVKYDAFKEMGGQLSFSLALLNDKNNGFILNSVHSSDGCYSYTKEIKNGECSIALGQEEEKALKMAIHCNEK